VEGVGGVFFHDAKKFLLILYAAKKTGTHKSCQDGREQKVKMLQKIDQFFVGRVRAANILLYFWSQD
jgi:hypothetical protein